MHGTGSADAGGDTTLCMVQAVKMCRTCTVSMALIVLLVEALLGLVPALHFVARFAAHRVVVLVKVVQALRSCAGTACTSAD